MPVHKGRLDLLGVHRPSNIIQAEIDSLLRTPGTDGCKVINSPVTQDTCPNVDRLRQELAASREVARLEADLVADRGALSEMPVAAFVAGSSIRRLEPAHRLGRGRARQCNRGADCISRRAW